MIITIDGPAGTGKSTVAKMLADRLKYEFLNTGAFYRAFAVHVKNSIDDSNVDEKQLTKLLASFSLEIVDDGMIKRYLLSKLDITESMNSSEISQLSSKISVYPKVRKAIVSLQREYASQKNIVAEGRDLGTVVFPKAQIKFFLTADAEIRAKRRFLELEECLTSGQNKESFEKILSEIVERDKRDSTRALSPLSCPEGAIIIDTTDLTADQVYHAMYQVVESHISKKKRFRNFLKSLFYKTVIHGFRFIFSVFYRLKVYGLENLQEYGGIIASNHVSFLDPPLLACSSRVQVHFLARESLFKIPILKNLIKLLSAHPIKGGVGDLGVIKIVQKLIGQKQKIIVFPEGTRSKDGKLQPLKKGVANIIVRTGSTVYPAYIHGAYEIWKKGKLLPNLFGRVTIVFGKPIHSSKYALLDKKEAQEKITQELYSSLKNLHEWILKGSKGAIP